MGAFWGDEDTIHILQPVTLRGPDGEALSLGYRTTVTRIVLGTTIKDQGYVLARSEDTHHFFPISADEIKQYQAQGALPNPLPAYSLTFSDYLMGYSFWIVLVFIIAWVSGSLALEKKKKARIARAKADA